MSTAVLISGQLRTFAKCFPTQRWHVLRHFEDPHFFITVQDGPEIQFTDELKREYGEARVHVDGRTDPDLSEWIDAQLTSRWHQAPYANAAPAHQLLLQHWYQQECWKFFQSFLTTDYTDSTDKGPSSREAYPCSSVPSVVKTFGRDQFDTIIRMRGDLWFHSMDLPSAFRLPPSALDCFTPWWGRFGGINDRFAIMGPAAAVSYFTVFDQISSLLESGCPFHPESIVKANLERGNVDLHETLRTEFSTLRTNGQIRHWTSEVLPCDLAA